MSLEDFKGFVSKRPNLAEYVKKKEMTWQEFYNLFTLYGENNSIWDKYMTTSTAATNTFSLKNMFEGFKNIDMNELQKGIGSLQKGIGYLQNLVSDRNNSNTNIKSEYEPRPIHKYFDD